MKDVFTRIYKRNDWGGTAARSGPGSEPPATAILRYAIPDIVETLGSERVLDIGCGDGDWLPDLPGYVGVDIVPGVVEIARFKHPDRTYLCANACSDPLPETDLIICRDVLMHLPLVDATAALENFRRTGAGWLIATTFRGGTNVDVEPGGFYYINMEAEPFRLGSPHAIIPDTWRHEDKRLGVWRLT